MKRIVLLVISLFFIFGVSNAQLGGLLKKAQNQAEKSLNKRLEKEVEKKVDKEVNKAIDKALDKAEKDVADSTKQATKKEQNETRSHEERLSGIMQSLGVGVEIAHKDVYSFDSKMDMLMEHTDDKGNQDDPIRYNSFFDSDKPDYAIAFKNEDGQQSHFIFDAENKCSLILTASGDEKTGIATSIGEEDIENWIEEDDDEHPMDQTNFRKTGRTKKISGFKCYEYLYDNEDGKASLWVTKDLKNKINRSLYKSSILASSPIYTGETDGVLIQYDYQSKTTQERSLMTVTSIDFKSGHSIDTAPYQIMGIRAPQ